MLIITLSNDSRDFDKLSIFKQQTTDFRDILYITVRTDLKKRESSIDGEKCTKAERRHRAKPSPIPVMQLDHVIYSTSIDITEKPNVPHASKAKERSRCSSARKCLELTIPVGIGHCL